MSHYLVMIRAAHVPAAARKHGNRYSHAALVELDPEWAAVHPGVEPAMVSLRARGVKRIVKDTGALYSGATTGRSEWRRAVAALRAEAEALNAKEPEDVV